MVSITGCIFSGCSASMNGGAISIPPFVPGVSVQISKTQFIRNTAYYGGALAVSTTPISVSFATFSGNTAQQGGAIWSSGATVLSDSLFILNNAITGGAVYLSVTLNSIFTNVLMVNNNATTGGGMFLRQIMTNGSCIFNDAVIFNNTAQYGGGLAVGSFSPNPVRFYFVDSVISYNTAINGGGIWISTSSMPKPAYVPWQNSTIQNNKATSAGGGLWVDVSNDTNKKDFTLLGTQLMSNTPGDVQCSSTTIPFCRGCISNVKTCVGCVGTCSVGINAARCFASNNLFCGNGWCMWQAMSKSTTCSCSAGWYGDRCEDQVSYSDGLPWWTYWIVAGILFAILLAGAIAVIVLKWRAAHSGYEKIT